jgi:taurine dioxygenase
VSATDVSRELSATPLAGAPYGAELHVDLAGPFSAADGDVLRGLLATHQFLLVRGGVSAEEHLRLMRAFGRVLPQGPRAVLHDQPTGLKDVIYLSNTRGDGVNGNAELWFHHEFAYLPTPCAGLSLYAEEVDEGVAVTRFASGIRAYQQLPDDLKRRLDKLQVLFVANYVFTTRNRDAEADPTWPRAVHPAGVPHPITGEPCIFVNQSQTDSIVGLDRSESDALIDTLYGYLFDPANVYEHHWQNGDLVIWDNLALQHARPSNNPDAVRTLRRITFGEKTPWEEWPRRAGESVAVDV